jgi:hypothetical protein
VYYLDKEMFCCAYCQRNYQRKTYFDRHVIACQFLSKSKKERVLEREELADTPSVRELYAIILELAAKCKDLETKMTAINKWAHITKQKLNITDWLNTTQPSARDYNDWFKMLVVKPADLQVLFEADYAQGVVSFLKPHLKEEERPMRAFTAKENTFYIYSSTKKWHLCEPETFTKLMHLLDNQFMREFISWQNGNKNRMLTDDSFSDLYAKNMKKIMGGSYTREQLYSRIKKELYMHLRGDPPNIVEYETTYNL